MQYEAITRYTIPKYTTMRIAPARHYVHLMRTCSRVRSGQKVVRFYYWFAF